MPRLGVVFAFAYPDDDGDLFAWAEGCGPLTRNGRPVEPLPAGRASGRSTSSSSRAPGDRDPDGNLACVTPARFRAVPSIAHRLALVAAGEAAAAVSLNGPRPGTTPPGTRSCAGRARRSLDEQGREVAYAADGKSRCVCAFGGRRGRRPRLARGRGTRSG